MTRAEAEQLAREAFARHFEGVPGYRWGNYGPTEQERIISHFLDWSRDQEHAKQQTREPALFGPGAGT